MIFTVAAGANKFFASATSENQIISLLMGFTVFVEIVNKFSLS
jgi:hypothetical protein